MFLLEYFFHSFQSVMSVSKYTALRDFLQVGNFTFCHFQEVIHQQSIAFSFWKLLQGLENNKYIVHYALNGAEGIELCKSLVPDLIILDIMLPRLNGNDVLQRLRKFTNAPVIVVSAKTMVQTKIDLLKLGADDYMTKPFDLHELLARIEANLKRTSNTSCQNDTLTYRDIEINNSLVYIKEVLVPFTSTELKILRLLLQYPQKIFSKQNLYESIWNETYAYDDDTINTHISHIRKKIKAITNEDYIQTIWGIGYKIK